MRSVDHFEEVIGAGAIGGGGQQEAASNETAAAAIASFTIFIVLGLLGGLFKANEPVGES